MTARVTIVTRTRDREVLLARALRSVSGQTFTDYELVVVNDAGDPQCVERALKALPEDFRAQVKVVNNPSSVGREAALEAGLNASHGEFFAIHDDDDSWAPGFLHACVEELDAHPEYGAVATRTALVLERLENGTIQEVQTKPFMPERKQWTLVDTLVANYVPPISQLIRRRVADEIGHWDPTLQTQADWEFNLRLLCHGPVGFLDGTPLAFWHQRSEDASPQGNSVVADALQHQRDHAAIRDGFARASMHASSSRDVDRLGLMLVSAEYFRRTEDRLEHLERVIRDTYVHAAANQQLLNTIGAGLQGMNDRMDARFERIDARISWLGDLVTQVGTSAKPLFRTVYHRGKQIIGR
ncbi:glycosyltransferase family 2 protein [Actinomyces trachealis]|uniref:glycosyltransferase family 2 protein n=1 Tax=Actinomyces trachealis TaxID=2763540 RepID=UPI001892903F|nr:glycosyltransferase family A protein [Actinomyces trachealis]